MNEEVRAHLAECSREAPREVAEQEFRRAADFVAMAEQFLKGAGGNSE
jgi:hypothetical protein